MAILQNLRDNLSMRMDSVRGTFQIFKDQGLWQAIEHQLESFGYNNRHLVSGVRREITARTGGIFTR